jgi:hypothetical protein
MIGLPDTNGKKLLFRDLPLDDESQTVDMSARLIAQADHFRLPPLLGPRVSWHKEWHHFCILSSDVQAILNLNLSGDMRPGASLGAQLARVILLVRDRAWDGDVDSILPRDTVVRTGLIDLRFGHNTVRFENGMFELSSALQDRPVGLVLQLRPVALPLLMRSNTPIGLGTINWLVVPRLIASGTITVGQRVHMLSEVPAYHDHNWGSWQWGHDFAWEWGFSLPDHAGIPWSLVFDRTTNRARSHVLELTLALWRDGVLHRIFTQKEIEVRPTGHLSFSHLPKFPRVMALVAQESTTDIPRYLDIAAMAEGDSLLCHFESEDVAQIIIPNDTDLGVTIINEVTGHLELEGEVKGESIKMQGRAIFEFLTG